MDPLTAAAVGLAVAYVTVAPDRATLAVSRGAGAAVRGGWTAARTEGVRAIDARAGYTPGQRATMRTGGVDRPTKRTGKRPTGRSTTSGPRAGAAQRPNTTPGRPGPRSTAQRPTDRHGALGRATRAGLAAMPAAAWTGAREALAARAATQQANAIRLKDVARARKTEHHQRAKRTRPKEDQTMAQRTSIGSGELTSVQQLLAEIRDVAPRLEQLHAELTEVGEWVSALPERYTVADFGTRAITDGVGAVAETSPDAAAQVVTALTEALQALYGACREAEIVTEAAATVQAEGNLSGFRGE